MSQKEGFIAEINQNYSFEGAKLILGKGILDGEVVAEAEISIPLRTMNRHGLIAGATGTGKTKTLQVLTEGLSLQGVPTLVMDIKGDLSGLAAEGEENSHITERYQKLGLPYETMTFPVEFLSLSQEKGVRLRATVLEFGPILFSKILNLNDTQQSIISIIFKYCDDKQLPLVDLQDLRKVLQYVSETEEGKAEMTSNYGAIASTSLGTILRSIVALEQEGANTFFGEPSFDVNDLLATKNGKGVINILRLTDIQNKPNLFSTFMLSLLAEVYQTLPEAGDLDKPKLAIFIDEAHLIFNEASKALLNQIETVIKLIRSKGVGIYFITQIPGDVPDAVLSQLGLKIQHALRGFTAKDRKEITKAIENYPTTTYYKADEVITQLGIGEAFITALNEKGIPTPLVQTYMVAPQSRMDVLTSDELDAIVNSSNLVTQYQENIDKQSAFEILSERMQAKEAELLGNEPISKPHEKSTFESVMASPIAKQVARTLTREALNTVFGMLGIGKRRR